MEENNKKTQVINTEQNTPSIQTDSPGSNVSKPKFKLPLIFIGIVLFLLIAGSAAGFFIVKQQGLKETSKPTTTQIVKKPSPTPDPTAEWKIYNDTDRGFSLKYPQDWSPYIHSFKGRTTPSDGSFMLIPDSFDTSTPNGTIEAPFIDIIQITGTIPTGNVTREGIPFVTDWRTITVDGISGVFYQAHQCAPQCPAVTVLPDKNISIRISSVAQEAGYMQIYNQILSTLKFNDSQTVDKSKWKTYIGKGFSIKYPATWKENSEGLITTDRSTNPRPSGDFSSGVGWINFIYPTTNFEETVKSNTEATTNEEVLFDNVKSRKLTGYGGIAGSVYTQQIITQNAGQVIVVTFSTQDTSSVTPEEVNQILSTFKFTK